VEYIEMLVNLSMTVCSRRGPTGEICGPACPNDRPRWGNWPGLPCADCRLRL